MKTVDIYTDAVCVDSPGKCGWAAIMMYNGRRKELSGGIKLAQRCRAELYSALAPLKFLLEICNVNLYSDSSYLVDAFNKKYINGWVSRNFQNKEGEDVENRDLWEIVYGLSQIHNITWIKVNGHSSNPFTAECELLARRYVLSRQEIKEYDALLKKNGAERGRF